MTSIVNKILQVTAVAAQMFNMFGGFVPVKYQGYVAGSLAVIQGTVGLIAHNFNPNGTPATQPYVKPVE